MAKAPAFSRWIRQDYSSRYIWDFLPEPAVYVVYLNGVLAYIGQSLNVRKRIQSYNFHYSYSNDICTPWGRVDSLTVKVSYSKKCGDWAMREIRLIKRLQPQENCVLSRKKRGAL